MRTTGLLLVVLAAAACSSQPTVDRSAVPDRPEVQRPDGVEPDGLADMRDTLAAQRADARERENAAIISPNELTTHPTTPWYETVLAPIASALRFFGLW